MARHTGANVSREEITHEPVLCGPLMECIDPQSGEVVLDATLGHAGHARLVAERIGSAGRLIGLDVDEANLDRSRRRLERDGFLARGPRVDLVRANFAELDAALDSIGVEQVDVLIADLGVSTDQLLDAESGLSFTEDGPLDMRLDDRLTTTAMDLVNALPEQQLADLIYHNSQERFSRRIAKRICQARHDRRIRTTTELARVVCSALGAKTGEPHGRIHPATRTFLALRMAVNDELQNLEALLAAAPERLAPEGRIAVISFHSGEDRIVKKDFRDRQRQGVYDIITPKPLRPSSQETRSNPRSRSAKLRAARRRADGQQAA